MFKFWYKNYMVQHAIGLGNIENVTKYHIGTIGGEIQLSSKE